jgi:hypothetical protein
MAFVPNQEQKNYENEFEKLPVGKYKCVVEDAKEKLSSNDQEMMSLKCKILEPEKYNRRYIWINIVYEWNWAGDMFRKILGELLDEITPFMCEGQIINVEMTDKSDFPKLLPKTESTTNESKVMDPDDEDGIPF